MSRLLHAAPACAAWGIALLGILVLVAGCGDTGGCGGG
jgi:hypothetical protein